MFLTRIEKIRTRKDGSESKRPQVMYKFCCDHCEKEYEKKPCNVSVSKSELHFCSNDCKFKSRSNGKLKITAEQTSFCNNGTRTPMQSENVKAKLRASFQLKYGEHVTHALHVPGAKEKRTRTHLERYGHNHTFQIEEFRRKRNVTWQHNLPRNFISKSELQFKDFLLEHFIDVKHQKWVNGHPIDFYIGDIDTYVQFDGVYWHGLDRPLSEHVKIGSPRSLNIVNHWNNDRRQDEWFTTNRLRLVRITDKEFTSEQSNILERLKRR